MLEQTDIKDRNNINWGKLANTIMYIEKDQPEGNQKYLKLTFNKNIYVCFSDEEHEIDNIILGPFQNEYDTFMEAVSALVSLCETRKMIIDKQNLMVGKFY